MQGCAIIPLISDGIIDLTSFQPGNADALSHSSNAVQKPVQHSHLQEESLIINVTALMNAALRLFHLCKSFVISCIFILLSQESNQSVITNLLPLPPRSIYHTKMRNPAMCLFNGIASKLAGLFSTLSL